MFSPRPCVKSGDDSNDGPSTSNCSTSHGPHTCVRYPLPVAACMHVCSGHSKHPYPPTLGSSWPHSYLPASSSSSPTLRRVLPPTYCFPFILVFELVSSVLLAALYLSFQILFVPEIEKDFVSVAFFKRVMIDSMYQEVARDKD